MFINTNFSVFTDSKTNIIIALYVNNILIINLFRPEIQRIKNILNIKFKISDLGLYSYYLSIIVIHDRVNRILRLE